MPLDMGKKKDFATAQQWTSEAKKIWTFVGHLELADSDADADE